MAISSSDAKVSKSSKPKAILGKDKGAHSVPGFLPGDSAPTWDGRKGYTSESKTGPGGNGRRITLPNP